MKLNGAIFDLDGTLFDSMPAWDNIGADYLLRYGVTPPSDLDETLKPLSFAQCAQYFIDEFGIARTMSEIVSEINTMVEDKYRYDILLKPYSLELLEKLKSLDVKMCVATAMDYTLACVALKRTGIFSYFDFVMTCGDINCDKDTPEFFLIAADKLTFDPKDIMVLEDSLHAIKSAKEAGFIVIGVYDESSEEDTQEISKYSDIYITSFKEMEDYL